MPRNSLRLSSADFIANSDLPSIHNHVYVLMEIMQHLKNIISLLLYHIRISPENPNTITSYTYALSSSKQICIRTWLKTAILGCYAQYSGSFYRHFGAAYRFIFKARYLTLEEVLLGSPESRSTNTNKSCITTPKSEHPIYTEAKSKIT
jgi:hypothetical protein